MNEDDLTELKEWLRVDDTDNDTTLKSLINTSKLLIKQSTNVDLTDVESDSVALELYKTLQKMIITDLYENRDGSSKLNPIIISMYTQLEAYKLGDVL